MLSVLAAKNRSVVKEPWRKAPQHVAPVDNENNDNGLTITARNSNKNNQLIELFFYVELVVNDFD